MSQVAGRSFKELSFSRHGVPADAHNQSFGFARADLISHCDRLCDKLIPSASLRRGYPAEAAIPSHCLVPTHSLENQDVNYT